MTPFKRVIRSVAVAALRLVPAAVLERLVYGLAAGKASGLAPAGALRFLLSLDQRLYGLQGEHAIRYGDGVHPKHRLIRYHDFLVQQVRSGERVLDVGCGIGAVAYDVAESARADVTGIDRDPKTIAAAQQRYRHPRLRFLVGDALRDLPAGAFDVVILSNLLEHVEDRVAFLRMLAERVQPKRYLIRVPIFERDWRVPLKQELGVAYWLDPTHRIEHRIDELMSELAQAGLEVAASIVRWGEVWAAFLPAAAVTAEMAHAEGDAHA